MIFSTRGKRQDGRPLGACDAGRGGRSPDERDAERGKAPACRRVSRAGKPSFARGIFRDEEGFTTTSMVLSLLITLALVFTGAQVYRVNSASAEVQEVADAAVLSAENQVGEFMVVARFCDAVVLSLSLTGIAAIGLGVAALCVPATAALSASLLKAGKGIITTRDKFADRASKVLNKLQEALPYYAAACAASVATSNNGDSAGARYLAAAVLVPSQGETIAVSSDTDTKKLLKDIQRDADDVRKKAKEAEDASKEAEQAKQRAFMRDCGDNPNYCMYERAGSLAGLSGGKNPLYTTIDAWSFSVALNRAKAYYRARYDNEAPANSSNEEHVKSTLRSHFYHFAVDEMAGAYVHESNDSFDAYFPHLPHNTAQMRETRLYTDAVYPVTVVESEDEDEPDKVYLHAWAGCPNAAGSTRLGSIKDMEDGGYKKCPSCKFTAASLGKVASASTSIDNGFEYHYEAVADEAEDYEEKRRKADPPKKEVKDKTGGFLEQLRDLVKSTFEKRIDPSPPGRYGAVAFVVNCGTTPANGGFASRFVASRGSLGPRAAISAATLVGEESDEGRTVINSMLDGLRQDGGAAVGAASLVLNAWSRLLKAYADGQSALTGSIKNGLNAMPLTSASGLGDWVAKKLKAAVKNLGLEPVDLRALKSVLVNSRYVAEKDDSAFARRFLVVKQRVVAASSGATDLFDMVLSDAERQAVDKVNGLGDKIDLASIEILGGDGPSIPVTIPIPGEVKAFGISTIQGLFDQLRAQHAQSAGTRVWQ